MIPVLILVFAVVALAGFLMTSDGQDLLKGIARSLTAPRDESRATTRHHQMALARANAQRKPFGKR